MQVHAGTTGPEQCASNASRRGVKQHAVRVWLHGRNRCDEYQKVRGVGVSSRRIHHPQRISAQMEDVRFIYGDL